MEMLWTDLEVGDKIKTTPQYKSWYLSYFIDDRKWTSNIHTIKNIEHGQFEDDMIILKFGRTEDICERTKDHD